MSKTEHYQLQKPEETKTVEQEIRNLQTVFDMLDAILHALRTDTDSKAANTHTHDFSGVHGLTKALSEKMDANKTFSLSDLSDVVGAAEAALGYILVKTAQGWQAQSAAAAIGDHKHNITDIVNLEEALADYLTEMTAADTYATKIALSEELAKKLNLSGDQMTGTLLGVPVSGSRSGFFGDAQGGSFADMRTRGAPFASWANHAGSSYAPAFKISYNSDNSYIGHWSAGVLNHQAAGANSFAITHVNADGQLLRSWLFNVANGDIESNRFKTPNGELTDVGNVGGSKWEAWGSYSAFDAISQQIERRANAWAVQEGRWQTGAFMTAERYPIGCCVLATISHTSVGPGAWVGGSQISIANLRSSTSGIFNTGHVPNIGSWESLGQCTRDGAGMFKRVQ